MKHTGVSEVARPAAVVEGESVRAQLKRILDSRGFATAKSAHRFLRYVVEETLAGRANQIKEYAIGVAVFDRGDNFDPQADAVVRVEAIRLRKRLQDYYLNDGRGDSVAIEVPKGTYAPVFRPISPADLAITEDKQFRDAAQINPEAYDCYLRGRFYSQSQNQDDNAAAISNMERAVAIAPDFAAAHAELAQAYVWKLFLFAPAERLWEEKAFVAAEKALSLDPNLAVAHLARGRLLWTHANHFPHEKAIREYRRALALNPNLDEARNQLALIYCHIGYFEQALEESEKATLTNPNNNLAGYRTAQTLVFRGQYGDALALLRGIPEKVNPALVGYQTAWALFNLGRTDEASVKIARLLKDYPQDSGGLYTSVQAALAAAAGDKRKAEAKIKLAIKRGRGFGHFHHTAYHIATAFALMKKGDQAIDWLETTAADGFPCYPLFESDPNLNDLRRDRRFLEFMVSLKKDWIGYSALF